MSNKLEKLQKHIQKLKKEIGYLKEENESLQEALDLSIKFYTVDDYCNKIHEIWPDKIKSFMNTELKIYCLTQAIKIKTKNIKGHLINSYPLTAWESYLGIKN